MHFNKLTLSSRDSSFATQNLWKGSWQRHTGYISSVSYDVTNEYSKLLLFRLSRKRKLNLLEWRRQANAFIP